ncbi:hypothetical protein [Novosphingobium sp. KN65.2]|uniref:hypothetical protein n=1 Tax=Novosphingobium sp. KN65.2 TaxID=1478134 RepID=UPI0005DD41BC|nr:hypothetical protein [Novosphingobium sp. KN65.2]CDO34549.1 hypothetical protein SPHV1_1660002 [Novosphingobium sp. KN65.2]
MEVNVVKVTDEDREVAFDAVCRIIDGGFDVVYLSETDRQELASELSEAFAAHREAATLKERERCAGVVDEFDIDWALGTDENRDLIATAIRNLKEG